MSKQMRVALITAREALVLEGYAEDNLAIVRIDEALSQREAQEPVACKTCNGTGVVDDGEIDCFDDGTPYECGPIKCVKDCPTCTAPPSREVPEEWVVVLKECVQGLDDAQLMLGFDWLLPEFSNANEALQKARALLASKGEL